MKSVMQHQFSKVPTVGIPRSTFIRNSGHKTTFDAGYLIPIYADEALPGDTFKINTWGFTRMNTPIFPVMDNMYLDTFWFAVPMRLLQDNWKKFMGEQDNPGDSTDFPLPTMTSPAGGYPAESLSDYLGIPINVAGLEHSSFFHRAYNLIYNEWFRDQNLINSAVVDKDDGPDDPADYYILKRCKRHDYFTSCLPWPQKSDNGIGVSIPLGESAPVTGIGNISQTYLTGPVNRYETDGTGTTSYAKYTATSNFSVEEDPNNLGFPNIRADLSAATAATINTLRQAFQLQRLLERDARGGTRYTELIRSHFQVTSPDSRQQRPEYLGGGSSPINITPVAATTELQRQVGDLAGIGVNVVKGHGFSKSFTEHCVILCLANVRADLTYQQGLPRMFSRETKYDYYWPTLAQIGEQAVLSKEIYADGTAGDEDIFGYQERYGEYRYKNSQITGKMRSTYTAPLDSWHLSQEFAARPGLNQTFIEEDPPIDRVVAVSTEPHFISDFYFECRCTRPMPMYGVPGMIDHF